VDPNGSFAAGYDFLGHGPKALAEPTAVLAMAENLEEPVGASKKKRSREQEAVKEIHLFESF